MNAVFDSDLPYAPDPGPDFGNIPSSDEWIHHAVVKDGGNTTYYRDGDVANTGLIPQAGSALPPGGFVQPQLRWR